MCELISVCVWVDPQVFVRVCVETLHVEGEQREVRGRQRGHCCRGSGRDYLLEYA